MADPEIELRLQKAKRKTIKGNLTRGRTYLTELDVPAVTIIELRQRLAKVNELWGAFDEAQSAIEELETGEAYETIHSEERTAFETKYFSVTVDLETLIERKLEALRPPPGLNGNEVLQGSARHRAATPLSQGSNYANDHLKLPRVTLQTFSGKYEEWITFRNMFQSMIHDNLALPAVQKMQYLVSSLAGEARDVVSSLEASEENYAEAWKMLKERYDDDSLIVQKHIRALFELQGISKENHIELRRLLDNVLKHLRALKALKRPTAHWDDLMIYLVTSRLDQITSKEWETTVKRGEIPTFTQLTDFLSQRCRALEASSRTRPTVNSPKEGKIDHGKGTTAHIATTIVMCAYCNKEDHPIYKCTEYLELEVDKRIQEARSRKMCLNCLKVAGHQAKQCSSGSCRKCNKRHNTLLHLDQTPKQPDSVVTEVVPPDKEEVVATSVNHASVVREKQVLLATAIVNVLDLKGKPKACRALLDNGSQSCFITTDCVKRLGLKQHATRIPISGLGELSTQARSLTKISLQSRINGFQAKLDCIVIEKITQDLPVNRLNLKELQIPDGITLADPEFAQPSSIDLLLGAEIFLDLLCIGKIKLSDDQPIWQKTLLGWIVSGNFMMQNQQRKTTICNLVVNEQLNMNLTRFWQIENTRTPEERVCEGHFAQTYRRNSEGRFVVTLPTRQEQLDKLGDSRDIALQRFKSLERKLERRPQLKKEYTEFVHEYLELQHMRELRHGQPSWDVRPHYYLPHHCVVKETSATTKLRVVFDASSKTTSGVSLNDALMVGPVLQHDLFSILLRFRSFLYALTADIAKMYRQVLVEDTQVPLQRILWRDQPTGDIKTYELLTLTYGTAPASFLSTKVIQQLADLEEEQFPKGAMVARRDFYVDDFISGANSKEEALNIRDQTAALLQKGGFMLRKWASNCQDLLVDLPGSSVSNSILELDKDGTSKTLGVRWHPSRDVLQYTISMESPQSNSCTKRSILSAIAQIFDPLGLLGPVILPAKILIQRLWKLQIDWDESLPSDIYTEWSDYVTKIQELNEFSVHRKIISSGADIQLDLHGFCDASERAYGACVYLRSSNSHDCLQVKLLCSKSRVSPLKTISIPRLELCGAQLLTQLMCKVKEALNIKINKSYYWTDSSIVLHWIKATNKKLPVFVAHRIGEIQEMTAVQDWYHVGTKDNPADLVSRGVSPKELTNSQLWWNGPLWLQEADSISYHSEIPPFDEGQLNDSDKSVVIAIATKVDMELFDKFSTLNRLVRVVAMCIRFARICRKEHRFRPSSPLSVDELDYARRSLIRMEQRLSFSEELNSLRSGDAVSSNSKLKDMNPFLDQDDILRVGGRLQHSGLQHDAKHPVILPQHSKFTDLIIEHEHKKNLHIGADATLAAVRLLYWPIRARGTVKRLLRKCITCFKSRPRLSEQIMGNLPVCRVTPSRPFNSTGVDFCGPIYVREGRRRNSKRIKAYIAVFVCMVTKAVHLEAVSDMSTEAFLNCFKRFIGRRGKPADMFSDNGTNFVGANGELNELRDLFANEEHQRKIIDTTSSEGIKWHFIPPRAPHFGGLWEAAVKSFKNHFHKVVSDAALTFEEASTVVAQVEAILNSRPLTALSSDPNDFSYLSAGHFLIGSSLISYPEPDITHLNTNRLSRWQRLEQIRQHFWNRWSSEYLLQLQRRTKWQKSHGQPLQVGQLVLCREDGLPPLKWVLGRVQEVCPGSDQVVRAAFIRTAAGVFKRPAVKLSVLPIENLFDNSDN